MQKRKKLNEYIEDKLLRFCKGCQPDRDNLVKARKLAKQMAAYIKAKWRAGD